MRQNDTNLLTALVETKTINLFNAMHQEQCLSVDISGRSQSQKTSKTTACYV